VGALHEDGTVVIDLTAAGLPSDMVGFIALGEEGLAAGRRALASGSAARPVESVKRLAPIPQPPRNIFCVGKNYTEHAKEFGGSGFDASNFKGQGIPDRPIIFTKAPSSVIGPGEAIPSKLDSSNSTDYEGELAVVMGRGGRGIPRNRAMDHVYGYTIINDVTARNIQRDHKQWFLGKSIDGFCPMGPYLVTADEVGDIREATLSTAVNGEQRQSARISQLIFDIPELIETLSRGITLVPGDVIATGTPAGVGIGFDPPKFLKPGDVVSITVERVGRLENPVA
jgi:2-keto-4-pentenoate hydratase/2-oxohepta-3-ene-1,7-dioic acid hydratase in catechol pathway